MNTLYIDTRDSKNIVIRLETDKGVFEKKTEAFKDKAQAALPIIEDLLKQVGIKADQINEVFVKNTGGSFTGVRVGIAIANALSFSLGVKINGKKLGEIVLPEY